MSAPDFPWLAPGPRRRARVDAQSDRRAAMYRAELVDRAALLSRLGYSSKRTAARLKANAAWDFDQNGSARPPGASDREIAEIVKAAYLRRANR